nr:basic endochitinase A-like [Quercus suber]
MAENSPLDVSTWISKLGPDFKDFIAPYGLSCVFPYHQIKVDEPLLRAAVNYWVHSRHIFCFNGIELCPNIEEFGAIMGEPEIDDHIFPTMGGYLPSLLPFLRVRGHSHTFFAPFVYVPLQVAVRVLAQSPVCGREADEAVCPNDECCGSQGLCGSTEDFCSTQNGCQSNCHLLPSNISDLINQTTFENMFSHRNDSSCEGSFYTYDTFMAATSVFGGFGRIGNSITQKREIAAFLAQTAYATAEQNTTKEDYCIEGSINWSCAEVKQYYGRGPIQLRYNTYYGPAGLDLGYPLLSDPDQLEKDPVMSFKSSLHYWMNYHLQKPHAMLS